MDTTYAQQPATSISPEIHLSRPAYASIPTRTSDDDYDESTRDKRSRFAENIEHGLGIQMASMTSPKSPGVTHFRQDVNSTKAGIFSPMFSPGPRPLYQRTPDTLYSFGSSITRTRTDHVTERLIAHRATQSALWHIHWRGPSLMVFSFFMGIVFALLQHFLYSYLHHHEEPREDKKFRWVLYGRALAYFSKVAFGGCVVLVFRQRIWRVFRERALTVLTIDQLFGATEDPSIFANWEAVSNAPIAVVIALVIWLIPLTTIIFSPGALTFGTYLERTTAEMNVPIIDFTGESTKNWRNPVKMEDGTSKKSSLFYNTTDITGTAPGWFDYYDQPSADLRRIALLLAYSNMNHPNLKQGARQEACGGSYNCTYEQSFVGPGYKCDEMASGSNDAGKLKELGAPFNMSILVPEGRYVYYADVDGGAYARPQAATFRKGPGGVPVGDPPADLGIFKSEPVLWIGYSVNSTEWLSKDDPLATNWTHRYDPHIMRCVHMETKYTVNWEFIEPAFHSMVRREYVAPVVDTNFTLLDDGTPDYSKEPEPAQNFVSPRNHVAFYKKTAAYHAVGDILRDFLRGHVDLEAPIPGPYYAQVYSDITKTRLVQKSSEPKKNLADEVESFYTDIVLSMLSTEEMLTVNMEKTVVNRTRLQVTFVYVPERLWQCYAPVIFITLLILIFGAFTIWEDGTTFSVGFSRLLVTTRNTTLDDISRGACLGNDPFPMELMHTRLKFGVLAESEVNYMGENGSQNVGHCAFGVASEIGPIIRGVPYAGLKQRKITVKKEIE